MSRVRGIYRRVRGLYRLRCANCARSWASRPRPGSLCRAACGVELVPCGVRRIRRREYFDGRLFVDNQVSRIFLLWRDVEERDIHFQRSEIDGVRWMPLVECIKAVRDGSIPTCIDAEELSMVAAAVEPIA